MLLLFDYFVCANIATGCDCHGTSLRSEGKIPRMKRSINAVPRRMSSARCGATPNHTRVFSSARRRCRRINPSRGSSYFVAVWSCGMFSRLMRLFQLVGRIGERIRLTPVSETTVSCVHGGCGDSVGDTKFVCRLGRKCYAGTVYWELRWSQY